MSGRVIDYGLAAHVDVEVSNRGATYGSDHALIVLTCRHGDQVLRIGVWNVERDRNRQRVPAMVLRLVTLLDLDALLLSEVSDYLPQLRARAGTAARVLSWHDQAGQDETAIVVRGGVRSSSSWCRRLTRRGWVTVRGGRTPAKFLPTTMLNEWLRVAVVHTAPSVRWHVVDQHGHRKPTRLPRGPARRVASYVATMRSLRTFAHRRPEGQSLLIAGDWNATPTTRGRWSPAWLADVAGLRFAAPKEGTHR